MRVSSQLTTTQFNSTVSRNSTMSASNNKYRKCVINENYMGTGSNNHYSAQESEFQPHKYFQYTECKL